MTFASTARTETTTPNTGRRVLVVDDNKDFVATIRVLLQLNGHYVDVAFDGLTGLEAAVRMEPDAIVLDVGLPKLNGYEVAHRIRHQRLATQPLIIGATGWVQLVDRVLGQYAGFDAHLIKPFVYEDLSMLLESAPVRSQAMRPNGGA